MVASPAHAGCPPDSRYLWESPTSTRRIPLSAGVRYMILSLLFDSGMMGGRVGSRPYVLVGAFILQKPLKLLGAGRFARYQPWIKNSHVQIKTCKLQVKQIASVYISRRGDASEPSPSLCSRESVASQASFSYLSLHVLHLVLSSFFFFLYIDLHLVSLIPSIDPCKLNLFSWK